MEMEGIKLPKGFYYGSCLCHIKESSQKEDVALIVSNTMCDVGIVYTKNIVKADPPVSYTHLTLPTICSV